jgi:hypothetical protein
MPKTASCRSGEGRAHRWLANAEADDGGAILRRRAAAHRLGAGAAVAEGVDAGGSRRGRGCPAGRGRCSGGWRRTRPQTELAESEERDPPTGPGRHRLWAHGTPVRHGVTSETCGLESVRVVAPVVRLRPRGNSPLPIGLGPSGGVLLSRRRGRTRWLADAEADHGGAILRRRAAAHRLGAGAAAAKAVDAHGPRRGRACPAGQRRHSGGWRRTRPQTELAESEERDPPTGPARHPLRAHGTPARHGITSEYTAVSNRVRLVAPAVLHLRPRQSESCHPRPRRLPPMTDSAPPPGPRRPAPRAGSRRPGPRRACRRAGATPSPPGRR